MKGCCRKKRNHIIIVRNSTRDIDYDKLAETIVIAQEKSEAEANKKGKFTSGTFSLLVSVVFRVIAVFGVIIAVAIPSAIINSLQSLIWSEFGNIVSNIIYIALIVVFWLIIIAYAFILWKSAKEIEEEQDRNYIISVFSGIVSFAALVVALVALFKGVG